MVDMRENWKEYILKFWLKITCLFLKLKKC